MDIYVEKKFSAEKLIPVAMILVIIIIVFFAFKFFTTKQEASYTLTPLPVPKIDYTFLISDEFNALDPFSVVIEPGTILPPGKSNPFSK
jgi:hypothetical protein